MAKKHAIVEPEPVPFDGLQLKQVSDLDIQAVGASVWVFMKRKDGGIVRVWISHPSRDQVPLKVQVEVEDV
jgi:hypothetical protein